MSGSFAIEGGQIVIRNGARVVSTTDGTLVNLLPTPFTTTLNLAFPDVVKDYAYQWTYLVDRNLSSLGYDNGCNTSQTACPQEYSVQSNVAAAPAGADIFLAMVRINRTVAPSHSWQGQAIDVLPKQNQWLPFSGSVLLEAELGFARAFSLFVSGGNLVLEMQQSVSTPAGGYGFFGSATGYHGPGGDDVNGGELVYGSQPGIPIVQIDNQNSAPTIRTDGLIVPRWKDNHRIGEVNNCSVTLATNFSSTYSVEVSGRFGRRS